MIYYVKYEFDFSCVEAAVCATMRVYVLHRELQCTFSI